MRRIGLRTALLVAVFGMGSLPSAFAQVTTATISGIARDGSGAVLPAAKVTVRNVQTGATRVLTTDEGGRYRAPQLPLGSYEIEAELSGFKTEVRRGIDLTVGREAVVDFVLQVGDVTEQVTVTAEAPVLETTSAAVSGLVDERKLRDLPLNTRSMEQFVFLMPTAISYSHYSGTLNVGFTPKISVAGSRTDQNVFLLDGTDINDYAGDTPGSSAGIMAGVETIKEYQVLTHNFSAEFGRSTGAVVNMATRTGTNELHGSAFEFLRNDVLDARNYFDRGIPPFRRNQFGGLLGGPIQRDRLFFMGSYEGLRQRLGVTNTSFVPDDNARQGILPTQTVAIHPAVRPYLDLYPRPNGPIVGGGVATFIWPFSNRTDADYVTGRVDYMINSNHNLFGRYTLDSTKVVVPLSFPFFLDQLDSKNQYTTLAETAVISPRMVNDFRVAFNRMAPVDTSYPTVPVDNSLDFVPGEGPGIISFSGSTISGAGIGALTMIGPSSRAPGHYIRNIYQVSDNINYTRGSHQLKFGGTFERIQTNNMQPTNRAGAYTFGSLIEFLQGRPSQYTQSAGDSQWGWRQSLVAMYFQDDYRPVPRLTLNLGVRYEFVSVIKEVNSKTTRLEDRLGPTILYGDTYFPNNPSLKNIAPRFGLSWQAASKTVLRVGVGLYHQQLMDRPIVFLPQGSTINSQRPVILNPPFPRVTTIPAASLTQVFLDELQSPNAIHYNLTVQRELSADTSLSVGYVGTQGHHLLHFAEGNTAIPTILPDGTKFFPAGLPRRNRNFGSMRFIQTDSNSDYHGLAVTLQRRFQNGFQYQLAYTYAKSIDEGSSTASSSATSEPQSRMDPDNRKLDRGRSAFDIRNNLVFNFTSDLPFGPGHRVGGNATGVGAAILSGWQLNGIITAQNGSPFTPINSSNRSRSLDPNANDRPNRNPAFQSIPVLGTTSRYFDPAGYQWQPAGFFGDAGRNIVEGPGLVKLDLAMVKNNALSERINMQLRFEAFNLLNRANFDHPNPSVFDSNGNILGQSGRIIQTVTTSRQFQFGLKFTF